MDKNIIDKYKLELMKMHGSAGNAVRTQGNVTQTQPTQMTQQPSPDMPPQPFNNMQLQPSPDMQQPPFNTMQQQPPNIRQQPSPNMQQPPFNNMQQPPPNIRQQPSPNMQQPPFNNMQQPPPNFRQQPSPNMQQPPFNNMQQPPPNIRQQPSPNMQQPPFNNMQQPPFNNMPRQPFPATQPPQTPSTMQPSLFAQPGMTPTTQPNVGETGNIVGIATTLKDLYPVENARVTIFTGPYESMKIIETALTDSSGRTPPFILPAPEVELSLSPNPSGNPYSEYNMLVQADGYLDNVHMQIPVFRGVTSLQRSQLQSESASGVNKGPQIFNITPFDL